MALYLHSNASINKVYKKIKKIKYLIFFSLTTTYANHFPKHIIMKNKI